MGYIWRDIFWTCVGKSIPSCKISDNKDLRWLTKNFVSLIHKRDRLFMVCRSIRTDVFHEKYLCARNTLKKIKKARNDFMWKLGKRKDGQKMS